MKRRWRSRRSLVPLGSHFLMRTEPNLRLNQEHYIPTFLSKFMRYFIKQIQPLLILVLILLVWGLYSIALVDGIPVGWLVNQPEIQSVVSGYYHALSTGDAKLVTTYTLPDTEGGISEESIAMYLAHNHWPEIDVEVRQIVFFPRVFGVRFAAKSTLQYTDGRCENTIEYLQRSHGYWKITVGQTDNNFSAC